LGPRKTLLHSALPLIYDTSLSELTTNLITHSVSSTQCKHSQLSYAILCRPQEPPGTDREPLSMVTLPLHKTLCLSTPSTSISSLSVFRQCWNVGQHAPERVEDHTATPPVRHCK
jgi:hypothetical protein